MAVNVGNLLTDPAAQSFISAADAAAYLEAEGNAAWSAADVVAQEAALVRASRWMAGALKWYKTELTTEELTRVGQVAARIAVDALSVDLYAAADTRGDLKRVKADTVEIEWAGAASSYQAGGRSWPWLMAMLSGLVCEPRRGFAALVV